MNSAVLIAGLLAIAAPHPVPSPVRFYPSGPVFLYPANPGRGYSDLMTPQIILINRTGAILRLREIRIEVVEGKTIVAGALIRKEDVLAATGEQLGMIAQGMESLAEMALPQATLGTGITLSGGPQLPPRGAFLVPASYLAFRGSPDRLRASATFLDPAGRVRRLEGSVALAVYHSGNEFTFPLRGAWYERSVPGVTSHHRWNPQTEFAMDYWKTDSAGEIARTSEPHGPEQFYGFGQPVLAAADGKVVAIENGVTQDWAVRDRRSAESDDDYTQRITRYDMSAIAADPHRALMGNYVVIEHAGREYSAYGHLRTGSVRVAVGAPVKRGEQIAEVGDTGDSQLVHLHFQISDGPDPLRARSIPFRFTNIPPDAPDLGHFVSPSP